MKLSDQCCTLKQSKKLQELGVVCESLWSWETDTEEIVYDASGCPVPDLYIPAYTTAELGMMLLGNTHESTANDIIGGPLYVFCVEFPTISSRGYGTKVFQSMKTEAHARASALIWLIEQGHLKAEEVTL